MFSHIYIEEKAFSYPVAKMILKKFRHSKIVLITHYKDFFCRPCQNFKAQKVSQKLILAVKENNFFYKVPEICMNDKELKDPDNVYYTTTVINCIYNCDYCFLQGMYPSANMVIFVNIDDYYKAAEDKIKFHPGKTINIKASYDSDILAIENIAHFTSGWIEFAANNPAVLIEVRTKSANFNTISRIKPVENLVLAWTLSPRTISEKYEKGSPSLELRISSIINAINKGWNVSLCFDPLLLMEDWKTVYNDFFDYLFSRLPEELITKSSIGTFRMPSDYYKKIKKQTAGMDLFYEYMENRNGIIHYIEKNESELLTYINDIILSKRLC